jgi:hypothetical protein
LAVNLGHGLKQEEGDDKARTYIFFGGDTMVITSMKDLPARNGVLISRLDKEGDREWYYFRICWWSLTA